ncbi:unnamed protein product [Rotaria sp. Silwood2]|nr:unnamed protein product [Rotaria sp. Silwood2]
MYVYAQLLCFRKKKQAPESSGARRKEGLRRRRVYLARLRHRIKYLTKISHVQKAKIKRLQQKLLKEKQNNQRLTNLIKSNNKISGYSVTGMDNNEIRTEQKDELPRGLNRSLRTELGLNVSNPAHVTQDEPSNLKNLVVNFMIRDDISKISPDVKKMINGTSIRYRLHNLNILHEQFEAETGTSIAYSTFSSYVPVYVKKPNLSDWGTCLCAFCLNPQIKLEKLIRAGKLLDIDADLCYIINDITKINNLTTQLNKLKSQSENITYIEWQKERLPNHKAPLSKKNYCSSTLKDFVSKFLTEIDVQHVQRIKSQFSAFKQARLDALNLPEIAAIQIDWSESFILKQAREERSAYYNTQNISINSGYIWIKSYSYGFGAFSDNTCHSAEATWASIQNLLIKLVKEENMKNIILITDSTWIYLESGHGKGTPDAIGAVIKKAMADAIAYNPDETFKDAKDLLVGIENRVNFKLSIYETKDIQQIKKTLPKLKPIKGTFELHEMSATKQGLLVSKNKSRDRDILTRINFFI